LLSQLKTVRKLSYTESVKSHKNVSLLTKQESCFMLSTDTFKISLFVQDDRSLVQGFLRKHYPIS